MPIWLSVGRAPRAGASYHALAVPQVCAYASMQSDGLWGELSGECTSVVATPQSTTDDLAYLVEGC